MIPEVITYEEAIDRYQCDRKAIRKAVLAGKIDSYKPGRHVLLDRKQADAWFVSTKQQIPARMPRGEACRGTRRGSRAA